MYWMYLVLRRKLGRFLSGISTTRIIALAFALIICIGTGLLMLPVASRSGVGCSFRGALFTATSATCVTGLTLFDTWTQWSGFGQVVILGLIEVGGLGFMSAASVFVFLLRGRMGMKQRLVMAQSMSVDDMSGVIRLQKIVLAGSLGIQGTGALILALRFWPELGLKKAVRWGIFHSVSAFCNAGFDIMGCFDPGTSVMRYNRDPIVCLTLMALVVLGGLGFFVWEEVVRVREFRKMSVYTRLVLIITGVLLLGGTLAFAVLEWNNPGTIGEMNWFEKLLNAAFQSVTVRTAGFVAVDQAALTDASKGVSIVLMLIGGSSGSTAGGIKTVTILVMFLFLWTRARGREAVTVFKRTIPDSQVLDAMTICSIVVALAIFGGVFISATSGFSFADALYESASAIATVGLSAQGSANLSVSAQYLIILYMYFGRVGVLTISLGLLAADRTRDRFRYAETRLMIG
ncbi:MAG: potassium uptake protein, TrkH family [Oscillospiraceae bacterium]|nr:potassium uptake protein, TrkH family [Oscillospiraceae bacterium]